MSTEQTKASPTVHPVVLVPKKILSARAITQLRNAGYVVVQATDVSQVKRFYPDSFNAASERAKIKAFDHAMGRPSHELSNSALAGWYIHFLKQEKAY